MAKKFREKDAADKFMANAFAKLSGLQRKTPLFEDHSDHEATYILAAETDHREVQTHLQNKIQLSLPIG